MPIQNNRPTLGDFQHISSFQFANYDLSNIGIHISDLNVHENVNPIEQSFLKQMLVDHGTGIRVIDMIGGHYSELETINIDGNSYSADTAEVVSNILINNTVIDTPTFAFSAYVVDTSFNPQEYIETVGKNSFQSDPNTFNTYVRDLSNSKVTYSETLTVTISDFTDYNHSTDNNRNWWVKFDTTVDFNNYYLSKAFNSNFNTSDGRYPLYVEQGISFNFDFALANNELPFNYKFDGSDNGAVPTPVDISSWNQNINTDSEVTLYNINSNANSGNGDFPETGTFLFVQRDAVTKTVDSSYDGSSTPYHDLPFQLAKSYPNLPVEDLTNDFQYNITTLFDKITADVSFVFEISAEAVDGGYYYDENPLFSLDDSDLQNNATYMLKNLHNSYHKVHVNNGSTTIAGLSNYWANTTSSLSISTGQEALGLADISNNGLIQIEVQDVLNRFNQIEGTGAEIAIAYDQTDIDYLNSTYHLSNNFDIGTIDQIDPALFTDANVEGYYQLTLNGYYHGAYAYPLLDEFLHYDVSAVYHADSKSVLYTRKTVPGITYEASGFEGNYVYISFSSEQNMTADDVSGLYNFGTFYNGTSLPATVGYTLPSLSLNAPGTNNTPNPSAASNQIGGNFVKATDVSGYEIKTNPSYNAHFLDPKIVVTDFNLNDLTYVQYRTRFVPKTLDDLDQDIKFTDGKDVNQNNSWFMETGGSQAGSFPNYYKSNNDPYLFMNNQNHQSLGDGLSITDLSSSEFPYEFTIDPNYASNNYYTFFVNYERETGGKSVLHFQSLDNNRELYNELAHYYGLATDYNGTDVFSGTSSSSMFNDFTIDAKVVNQPGNNGRVDIIAQFPFGKYTNVYIHYQGASADPRHTDASGIIQINQNTLMGLFAYVEGTTNVNAHVYDISGQGGWTLVSDNDLEVPYTGIHVDALSAIPLENDEFTVDTSVRVTSQGIVVDPNGQNGQVDISLPFLSDLSGVILAPNAELYYLAQPAYAILLKNDLSNRSYNLFGSSYQDNETGSFNDYDPSAFNPAKFPVYNDPSRYSVGSTNLDLSFTIDDKTTPGKDIIHITSGSTDFVATITVPRLLTTDFNIWYCPENIWYYWDSIHDADNYERSHDPTNETAWLDYGVALLNSGDYSSPDVIDIEFLSQNVSVNPVNNHSGNSGFYYDTATNVLTSLNVYGLTAYNNGENGYWSDEVSLSRYVSFPKYRGYHSNHPAVTDLQQYSIVRHNATIEVDLGTAQTGKIDGTNYMYKGLGGDITFSRAGVSTFDVGSIGLSASVNLSMLSTTDPTDYHIRVMGDQVTVYASINGEPTLEYTTDLMATNGNLWPDQPHRNINSNENNHIIAGRVSAYGMGNSYVEGANAIFRLEKSSQYVDVYYGSGYLGDPRNNVNDEYSYNSYSNADLLVNGRVHLTNSIDLYIPSDNVDRNSDNAPYTYLVSAPLYFGFTGNSANSVQSYDDYLELIDPTHVNQDKVYTYYYPIVDTSTTSYYPFESLHDNSMNNMHFNNSQIDNFNSLRSYVNDYDGTYDIKVQANKVRINETLNGTTTTLYNDFITLLPQYFNDVTHGEYASVSNGVYSFQYDQPNSTDATIYAEISNPFAKVGTYTFSLSPNFGANTTLYGATPFLNDDGEYAIELYKFTSNTTTDYANLSSNKFDNFYADTRYTKTVSLPTVDFGSNIYTLQQQINDISIDDTDWVVDPSFNGNYLNFELAALNNSGVDKIWSLLNVTSGNMNSINYIVNYFTLPDIMNVQAADGSTVYRVAFNGTVAAPAISVYQVNLNTTTGVFNHDNPSPNQLLGEYNVEPNQLGVNEGGVINSPPFGFSN